MYEKYFIIYECLIGFIAMIILCVACRFLCKKNRCCFWFSQKNTSQVKKIIDENDKTVPNDQGDRLDSNPNENGEPSKIVSVSQTPPSEGKKRLSINSKCGATWALERKATMSPSKHPIECESEVIDQEKISTPLPYEKFKQLYKCDGDVSPVRPPGWSFKFPITKFGSEKKSPAKIGSNKWGKNLERVKMADVPEQFSEPDMDLDDSWSFPKVENVKLERDLAQDFVSELHLNQALGLDSPMGGDQL